MRDITRLGKAETVATLVPGANYFLGLEKFPPARKLIDAGVAVALATDYNPGSSPTASMPFVLSLACTHLRMSPAEAIAAATINGAWSLRLQERKGSIEPGKDADLAVFDVADYREIAYWVASDRCAFTVLNGAVAVEAIAVESIRNRNDRKASEIIVNVQTIGARRHKLGPQLDRYTAMMPSAKVNRPRRFERTLLRCYNRACSKRFQRLDCLN